MPRWRGHNHFEEALLVAFTDGSKHEDLSKVYILIVCIIMIYVHTLKLEVACFIGCTIFIPQCGD